MSDEKSLWNLSDGKTKTIIEFITELSLPMNPINFNTNKFFEIKKNALNQISPDKMLKMIGYQFSKQPKIYGWCKV